MAGGGGAKSWIFYIVVLLAFNALSYFFNWGWTIY